MVQSRWFRDSEVMTKNVLGTPAQIFANIPGLLGFFPEESVVFLNFTATTAGTKVRLSLDFASRADITDWRSIDHACDIIAQHKPDSVWALVIAKKTDPFIIDETLDEIVQKAGETNFPLAAIWVTEEIATGTPYFLAGTLTDEDGTSVIPDTGVWEHGTICDVATAVSTKQMVGEGNLPELTRSDVLARFAHGNPYVTLSSSKQKKLTQKARTLVGDIRLGGSSYEVRNLFVDCLDAARDAESETALLKAKDALLSMITLMSDKLTRDLILDIAIERAEDARMLCLAVAKTATGFARHNALCVYVLASIAADAMTHNFAAVEVILKEDPQHVLAQCIGQACMHGIHSELLEACLEGTHELLSDIDGIDDDDDYDDEDEDDDFEDFPYTLYGESAIGGEHPPVKDDENVRSENGGTESTECMGNDTDVAVDTCADGKVRKAS